MKRAIACLALLGVLLGSPLRAEAPTVAVRAGQHPTFGRVVFDWMQPVEVELAREGDRAVIRFDRPAVFDLNAVSGRNFAPIGQVTPRSPTEVEVQVPAGLRHRHFRDGTKVVVDFMVEAEKPADKPAAAQPGTARAAPPAAPAAAQPASGAARAQPAKPVEPARPVEPAKSVEPPKAAEPPRRPAARAPVPEKAESGRPAPPIPTKGETIAVTAEPIPGGGVRLRAPWPDLVAAAVFERGGRVWVVFGRPATLDLTGVGAGPGVVAEARQLADADAAMMVLRTRRPLVPVIARRDNAWIVDLKDPAEAIQPTPLGVVAEPRHPAGPRVSMPTQGAGMPVRVRDAEVGDQLVVVPITRVATGMQGRRDYPQFALLPSAQGIVVAPKVEGVEVEVTPQVVSVLSDQGLLISGIRQGRGGAGDAASDGAGQMEPLAFRAWAGPPGQHQPTKVALHQALIEGNPKQLSQQRMALARFHFANGNEAEALGILQRAAKADPRIAENPHFRLLRAAALVEMGRPAKAEPDLMRPELAGEPEAALWRGRAAEALGEHAKALPLLKRGEPVLRRYPPERQAPFRHAMFDAQVGLGDLAGAKSTLAAIDAGVLPAGLRAETQYREALLALRAGETTAARQALEAAAQSPHRPVAERAKLALIEEKLATGELKPAQAVEAMDRLRVAWRGDDFEPQLLRRIGALHIQSGKWREGFDAWRQASTLFAKTPYAKQITEDLAEAFERLFLSGEAEKLPPVEALGIYYQFRELTPAGAKGDEMIRRLADRLAAVDLLGQAADLIEHQVNFRTKGEERARLANRLSVLRLLDRQPDKALKALETTRGQPLAADLALERKLLEARALGDLGRFEEARAAIAGETGALAESVRLELAWRAKDWPLAAKIAGRLAEAQVGEGKPDEAGRKRILQWATALALAGEEAALDQLRGRFTPAFEGTPEVEAFLVLTSRSSGDPKNLQELSKQIAGVGQIEAFLAAYRERVKSGSLSAVN